MDQNKHIKKPDFIPDIENEYAEGIGCVVWGVFLGVVFVVGITLIIFIVKNADKIDSIV